MAAVDEFWDEVTAPPRGYEPQSYVPDLDAIETFSALAEQADWDYAVACADHAEAKNAEDKAYFTALLTCGESSEAARDRVGRAATVEQRAVRRIKESAMESAKEHLRTVLARLSAAQTQHKTVDRLGG